MLASSFGTFGMGERPSQSTDWPPAITLPYSNRLNFWLSLHLGVDPVNLAGKRLMYRALIADNGLSSGARS